MVLIRLAAWMRKLFCAFVICIQQDRKGQDVTTIFHAQLIINNVINLFMLNSSEHEIHHAHNL